MKDKIHSFMSDSTTDFLVIGAGLAGLAFAGDAQAQGKTVTLLDKGRGVGGRAATRRLSDTRTDHGAQFFTARDDRFQKLVDQGLVEGWVRVWSHGFPVWKSGSIENRPPGHARYAPPGGMSDLPKQLAKGLNVQTSATITRVERNGETFRAISGDGRTWEGHFLILNLPPVQLLTIARALLPEDAVTRLEAVTFDPAWTLIARLERDVDVDWPALEVADHPVLGWMSRDHTKRGPNAPPVLVAHGSGTWSKAHLEDDPAEVQNALLRACEEIVGSLAVSEVQTHRWRYAQPTQAFGDPFLWLEDARIGACGDWCGPGGRIEGAILSGWKLAVSATQ